MIYDTAGNQIWEPIICRECNSTGGCDMCRLSKWKFDFNKSFNDKHKKLFHDDEIGKETFVFVVGAI